MFNARNGSFVTTISDKNKIIFINRLIHTPFSKRSNEYCCIALLKRKYTSKHHKRSIPNNNALPKHSESGINDPAQID